MLRLLLVSALFGIIGCLPLHAQVHPELKSLCDSIGIFQKQRNLKKSEDLLREAEDYCDADKTVPAGLELRVRRFRARQFSYEKQFREASHAYRAAIKRLEVLPCEERDGLAPGALWLELGKQYYRQEGNLDSALFCLEMVIQGCDEQTCPPSCTNLGDAYYERGNIFKRKRQIDQAILSLNKAVNWYQNQKQLDTISFSNVLEGLGIAWFRKGDKHQTADYFEQALSLREQFSAKKPTELVSSFLNLASLLIASGEYEKAHRYLEKADQLLIIYGKDIDPDRFALYNYHQALLHEYTKEYEKALFFAQKSLEYRIKANSETHRRTVKAYYTLGNAYGNLGRFEEAETSFRQALKILDDLPSRFYPEIDMVNQSMAKLMQDTDREKEALKYLEVADNACMQGAGPYSFARADVKKKMGDYWETQGQCSMANISYAQALVNLFGGNKVLIEEVSSLPERYRRGCFAILLGYGSHLQGCFGQNPDSLSRAHRLLYEAEEVIDLIRKQSEGAEELEGLFIKANSLLNCFLVDVDKQKGEAGNEKLGHVFSLSEKNTAVNMKRAFGNVKARKFGLISSELLDLERKSKVEVAYYQRMIESEQQKVKPDSSKLVVFKEKLFDNQSRLDSIGRFLLKKYPRYYNLKYDQQVASLDEVQRTLPPATTMISYVLGKKHNYAFVMNAHKTELVTLPLFETAWIDTLRKSLTAPYVGNTGSAVHDDSLLRHSAHQLYQHLIAPFEDKLTERLVIIPAGELAYLPFEVLLTQEEPAAAMPSAYAYLLKRHSISYAFSATSYCQQKEVRSNGKGMLAMAPDFDGVSFDEEEIFASRLRSELVPLKHNKEEVHQLGSLLGASTWTGAEASLGEFLKNAPHYNMLHLSTHAGIDEQNHRFSYIAFSPDSAGGPPSMLYLADLYGLELHAEMVVLSACNTASGKLQHGEGVASMSRGFAYAGARSLVTTLWQVDDARTAELMRYLYEGLEQGLAKDVALQQAKIRLMEEKDLAPFFWAAPIATGDMRPVQFRKPASPWLWLGFVLLVGLISFGLYQRN